MIRSDHWILHFAKNGAFPSRHLPAIYKRSDVHRHRCRLCFFLSFFLSGHWEVETSRTSRRVASPCSCLPAVREGFAVNKRLGHQRGGIIHGVMSALMSHSVSAHEKYLYWSVVKSGLQLGIWPKCHFLICSIFFSFGHNVFQGERRRRGRMSMEGGRLHWTAGCPSVTGPGPVYKWRSR